MNWPTFHVFVLATFFTLNNVIAQHPNSSYIVIQGNRKTKTEYIKRFIKPYNMAIPDSQTTINNLRKLRNLPSIMDAQAHITYTDSGTIYTYEVSERYTLFPVGDFGVSDEDFWIGGGLMQSNLLGRGLYVYGYYQYNEQFTEDVFAQHPFLIILRNPYLKQSNLGFEIKIKSSPGMEQYNGNTLLNEYFHMSIATRYEFRVEHELTAGAGYTAQQAWYRGRGIWRTDLSAYNERYGFEFFAKHDIRKLDYHYFYIDGWRNRFFISLLNPREGYGEPVLTAVNEFIYYKRLGLKANIAARLNAGISNNIISVFNPFIADNYYNIRGLGYRAFRGNVMALSNIEYRQTLYENRVGGIQAIVFTDAGYIANRHSNTNTINGYSIFQSYGGLGLRVIYKKAYNAILSIDYGFDIQNLPDGTWVIGWGQYF